ncbi:MAG: UDP-3-O-(3-hydroxymyristoyl)glucosamine N-acyltransferase [Elusimicrobia bacterium]|nr:UDP-3-O-(3-hydroxymyristoyl)glucosamine N-acyltransferase [Elusimicrobiota bacterium]
MRLTVQQITELVSGKLEGDPQQVLEGAASLGEATPKDVSFLAHPRYAAQLRQTQAGCVLLPENNALIKSGSFTQIYVKNPQWAFAQVLSQLEPERRSHPRGVHATALIASSAKVAPSASLGAYCVIEEGAEIGEEAILYPQCYVGRNSKIGRRCLLYPQTVVREEVEVGEDCILHSGCVLGADGYGYVFMQQKHKKIPQLGRVKVEAEVEIGANVTVDRATIGTTTIGKGTKIDNLVQIAHNVQIGEHCLIIAQAGIAGSTKIGNGVILAGQAGVIGHITVGDQVRIGAQSGVIGDVPAGAILWGTPAQPHRQSLKLEALQRKLPKLFETVRELKKKLGTNGKRKRSQD